MYNVPLKPIWDVLHPKNLLWIYIKNTGFVALLNTNVWLMENIEAEERALETGEQAHWTPMPDPLVMAHKSIFMAIRETLTTFVRRVYEHLLFHRCSRRTACKYLKDYRASLTRKARFYVTSSWVSRLSAYYRTILRTTSLQYAADFTVAVAYEVALLLQDKRCRSSIARLRRLGMRTGKQLCRCFVTWLLAAAAGAATATWAKEGSEGRYAALGIFVADFAVTQAVVAGMDWQFPEAVVPDPPPFPGHNEQPALDDQGFFVQ